LSAGLGTPTVGLFGSTSPALTSPLGPRAEVIYADVHCSPCFEKECPKTDNRYQCLLQIEPSRVFEVAKALLKEEENG
ncbi:MAG: glycosyltransferase family 9 protein, partial [bacterium]